MKDFTGLQSVQLEEDEYGNLFVPFPQELMDKLGWKENDTLEWKDNQDGTFTIIKVD
jgi:phytoene/squalene synthetase